MDPTEGTQPCYAPPPEPCCDPAMDPLAKLALIPLCTDESCQGLSGNTPLFTLEMIGEEFVRGCEVVCVWMCVAELWDDRCRTAVVSFADS
jgi:hypothetical protein